MKLPSPEDFPFVPRARGDYDIDVFELNERLHTGNPPLIVDVRRKHELDLCKLPGIVHVPIEEMEQTWQQFLDGKQNQEIALICRTGKRSENCRLFLKALGFTKVRNMIGGMHAWADAIDPTIPKY